MNKRVKIVNLKALPLWLMIIVLVAVGGGAAAGTVLAGKVTGEVPISVSQALLVEAPVWVSSYTGNITNQPQPVYNHIHWIHAPNRSIGVASDDNVAFEAAAELSVGDWVAFSLPVKNASNTDLVALLSFDVPEGIEIEVFAGNGATNIGTVVRIGMNTWKVLVRAGAEYHPVLDSLMVVISVDDDTPPGFFSLNGTFKQIPY